MVSVTIKIILINCAKFKEQTSTSVLLIMCNNHRSRSVYICNMQHWQVLQLQQHLCACICCCTCNNDSNHGSTCYSSSSIAFPIPSAACSSNSDSTCSTSRSTCTTVLAAAASTGAAYYVQNRRVALTPCRYRFSQLQHTMSNFSLN